MNVIPVPRPTFLVRVARALALALAFLCIGTIILMVLQVILVICVIAVAEATNPMPTAIGLARDWGWWLLIFTAAMAGVTGLLAGIYEVLLGRANTWVILIISSLVISSEPLILEMARKGSIRITWMDLAFQAVGLLWFGSGMMACWKMTDIVRDKIPAVDAVQLFD
jgi:hypothetical protein